MPNPGSYEKARPRSERLQQLMEALSLEFRDLQQELEAATQQNHELLHHVLQPCLTNGSLQMPTSNEIEMSESFETLHGLATGMGAVKARIQKSLKKIKKCRNAIWGAPLEKCQKIYFWGLGNLKKMSKKCPQYFFGHFTLKASTGGGSEAAAPCGGV